MLMDSGCGRRCAIGTVFAGMAISLDGYIQSRSGDLSWLNDAMAPDEDYGFAETLRRTGAYVMGARTYREMGGGASGSTAPTYVVTHDPALASGKHTHSFAGDLRELIERLKAETDKDICVFGGANLVTQCLELDLLDELAISVIPVVLGGGVPFLPQLPEPRRLELRECKNFPSGIVLLNYRVLTAPSA